ncbi:putative odorant receptor 71a isoform X1 [Drosophila yakuba]|uniref:putative odorant receptor 71a isoform X1 n=1 Tax=Drosophila yakuba TaxID=7245 RepID=UPI00193088EE|nr:putative odorant receptor 71a isoform X1 [Drosophila yakuba]
MDYDRIRPVRYLTGILKWWRLWPRKESVSRPNWTNWQGYALHVPFTWLFVVLLWVEAIRSRDIQHTADVLLICLTTTALGGKMINNWKYAHVAQCILTEWSTCDLFELRSQQEVDMWRFEHRRFSRVFMFYCLCSAGVIPFIVIQPLFDIPNQLPFWMWTPFDWRQPALFWYPFIYQAITIPVTCMCNITMDAVNWYMMLHLSLCLRMLGQRLGKLQHDDRDLRETFLELVQLHRRLKQQALGIECFISKSTFTQILVSSLIICFTIYSMQMVSVCSLGFPIGYNSVNPCLESRPAGLARFCSHDELLIGHDHANHAAHHIWQRGHRFCKYADRFHVQFRLAGYEFPNASPSFDVYGVLKSTSVLKSRWLFPYWFTFVH